MAVDAQGRPLRIENIGGHVHDSQVKAAFLDWEALPLAMVLDKAHRSAKIRRDIGDEGALTVIPAKANGRNAVPHDAKLYAMHNIVARHFCKIREMRRLATRFEKSRRNFFNMIYLFEANSGSIESTP